MSFHQRWASGLVDVSRPRDHTHCQHCRKPIEAGDFVMSSLFPVNKRRPYKYRARIAHLECDEQHRAEMWRQRGRKA